MPDRPSRKEFFEATLSGAAQRPPLPPLRHDRTNAEQIIPHSLKDYRALESAQHREARLRALWRQLPSMQNHTIRPEDAKGEYPVFEHPDLTPERAEELRRIYVEELLRDMDSAGGSSSNRSVDWETFRSYADQKEAELWAIFHDELDLDGNGHLDCDELRHALDKAGKYNHIDDVFS
jgi:solute carrier family 25 (mitochondrial phosphate transporter), member 23/24/25/41